jgi:putative transposase
VALSTPVMKQQQLGTIWEIPDDLWQRIEPILLEDAPPKTTGRKRTNWRRALDGILFRLRSGCQWNKLPKEFGDDSSVHRWFQRWCKNGVLCRIWALLVEQCAELGAVYWQWQSADGAMGKARFGGEKGGQKPHRPRQKRHEAQPGSR